MERIVRFGIIADIQYADIPDGFSFRKNPRYYRNALHVAAAAVAQLNDADKVDCVWNLGDIVDAKNGHESAENALELLLAKAFALSTLPVHHIYGNHEIELFDRSYLRNKLQIPFALEEDKELVGYYSFLYGEVRFIAIDTYDICMQRSGKKREHACKLLDNHNPNTNKKSPAGLVGTARRYVAMGGGVGACQLVWLKTTLELARQKKEMVVIFSHQPLSPESVEEADLPASLAWNYAEIQGILNEYSGNVACCFSGHAHRYGYARDKISGIHYRVMEAALESKTPTFALIEIRKDSITLQGFGDCKSERYSLDHLTCRKNDNVRVNKL